jgi:hypothetical protein
MTDAEPTTAVVQFALSFALEIVEAATKNPFGLFLKPHSINSEVHQPIKICEKLSSFPINSTSCVSLGVKRKRVLKANDT